MRGGGSAAVRQAVEQVRSVKKASYSARWFSRPRCEEGRRKPRMRRPEREVVREIRGTGASEAEG